MTHPPVRPSLRVVPDRPDAAVGTAPQRRTAWTAADLMAATFPPPRWAVPGIVPEGLSLLAGMPKVGKSWMSLGWGLDIAAGQPAFGTIGVQAGPVLYLALEDPPRRLQFRIGTLLQGRPAPADLTIHTACPPLPQGGDTAIAAWLDRHPDARMVVIDVFEKVRGSAAPGASAYAGDYAAVSRAKRLADHYGVAVVLVHHVRKASADDFLAEVSGTNGLAGAADTILVLKRARGQADAVMHITGRDVDEAEHALSLHPATGAWHLLDGPAEDHGLSETRATIRRYIRQHPGSTPKDIAGGTGLSHDNVKKTCPRMAEDGQLHADQAGRYTVPAGGPAVPAVPAVTLTSTDTADAGGQLPQPGVPGVSGPDEPAGE